MSTLHLLILCGTLLLLAALAAGVAIRLVAPTSRKDKSFQRVSVETGTTVVLHTRDQHALRGTVTESGAEVELEDAALVADGQVHAVGGRVRVASSDIAWSQVL